MNSKPFPWRRRSPIDHAAPAVDPAHVIPQLIGAEMARKLFHAFGGEHMSFPSGATLQMRSARRLQKIQSVVGVIAARELARYFEGAVVCIPRNPDASDAP